MDKLPEIIVDKIYRFNHEILFSSVIKQLKTYRLNTHFIVSLEFLEHGYFEFGGIRTPCININNINSTSYEILCLINNDYNNKIGNKIGYHLNTRKKKQKKTKSDSIPRGLYGAGRALYREVCF